MPARWRGKARSRLSTSARGEKPSRPQFCRAGLKQSGGAPMLRPTSRSCWSAPRVAAAASMPTARSAIRPIRMPAARASRLGRRKGAVGQPLQEQMIANFLFHAPPRKRDDGVSVGPCQSTGQSCQLTLRFRAPPTSERGPPRTAHARAASGSRRSNCTKRSQTRPCRRYGEERSKSAAQVVVFGACRVRPVDQRRVFQPRPWATAGCNASPSKSDGSA